MNFYTACSAHGSASSHGFCNDTIVNVFNSKAARDDFVANSDDLSLRAIKRKDVTSCATNTNNNGSNAPVKFSGEFWGIVPFDDGYDPEIKGCIGTVERCMPYDNNCERFYK